MMVKDHTVANQKLTCIADAKKREVSTDAELLDMAKAHLEEAKTLAKTPRWRCRSAVEPPSGNLADECQVVTTPSNALKASLSSGRLRK